MTKNILGIDAVEMGVAEKTGDAADRGDGIGAVEMAFAEKADDTAHLGDGEEISDALNLGDGEEIGAESGAAALGDGEVQIGVVESDTADLREDKEIGDALGKGGGNTGAPRVKKRTVLMADDRVVGGEAELPPLSPAAEKSRLEFRQEKDRLDRAYQRLRSDARATCRQILCSAQLDSPEEWEKLVLKGDADFRSGKALMDQLGADARIDAQTAAVLLAMRVNLIEDTKATSAADYMTIDMAIIAHANAIRVQRIISNMALLLEAELFGQELPRRKWRREHGRWDEKIDGLVLEDYLARLSDDMMPLVERFQRIAQRHIEAITRKRNEPAAHLEQLEPLKISLTPGGLVVNKT